MTIALDEEKLVVACRKLSERDTDLAFIFQTFGTPPLWARQPGFATLVHIILEQQVSVASAKSAFDKLVKYVEVLTPENFLKLTDAELKAVGFSRQKTGYARGLAEAVLEGKLDLKILENLSDAEVKAELKKLKGIGDWTSDIYLLMGLMRPDVMPKGDLALHIAWQKLKTLELRPTSDEFLQIAERWKPFRAVAARLLWHFYLSAKNFSREQTRNNTK
jgi:DNA-3-methyladenine glycosylase II